jgi:3-keto-L-gulonate-6-phosphate decarboxylase
MQQYGRTMQFVCLFLVSFVYACSAEKSSPQQIAQVLSAEVSQPAAPGCDASLWNHVYSPKRLKQLASCVSVTGTIDESNVDEDGDQHFLLKLDAGQDTLLNKRNAKKKGGDMVLEIVCANPTTMKKARSACAGYTNPIRIPAVGEHVKVTGTYVLDSHNGWVEIHPVSTFSK